MSEAVSIFDRLNAINVNEHTEKKQNLTYLSWAWAWGEVKKCYPDVTYTIYERQTDFGPVNYFTDGRTCWVKTGLTINGLEHIEELPVMDFRNNSIPLENVKSTDVNKAIQRSLTKAAARHGLGLYIYAGEDLPEAEAEAKKQDDIPKNEERKEPTANVSKGATVPPVQKGMTAEQHFVACCIARMKKEIPDFDFTRMRKILIDEKAIEDKNSAEMTMDEGFTMVVKLYQRFGGLEEADAKSKVNGMLDQFFQETA